MKNNLLYLAPEVEVVEIQVQVVMCQSGGADDAYIQNIDPWWL